MLPSSGVLGDAVGGRLATEGRTVGFLLGAFEGIRVGTGVLVGAKETDGAAVGEFVLVGEAVDGAPTRRRRSNDRSERTKILRASRYYQYCSVPRRWLEMPRAS